MRKVAFQANSSLSSRRAHRSLLPVAWRYPTDGDPMTTPYGEKLNPEPTPVELTRLRAIRESIAEELPDLVARE